MNPYSPPGLPSEAYPAANLNYGAASSAAVSETTVELLRQTRPWVMLLSILAFVGSGLMAVVGLCLGAWAMLAPGGKGQAAVGLIYVPLALFYIYPGLKLWGYGSAIARLMDTRSSADLEDALGQQRSFWKFSGIASVIVLGLYAIGFVVLIAVGALAAAGLSKLGQ
jgi:hypothetical protein